MAYTQANRFIAIDTPLGDDVVLLHGFTGEEGISQLFRFTVDLLSEEPSIDYKDIIGKNVTITVKLADDSPRYINGFVSRFGQSGSDARFTYYQAEIVPWLWFLTRTADCRIFQNLSIPDIIQKVFKDLGFNDFKVSLRATYKPRDYCVQYRETDFNFVARLMEQYGIFYFFEHRKGKHTLVLGDGAAAHAPCPKQERVHCEAADASLGTEDVITELRVEQELRTGRYALTDYNFETPSTSLLASVPTTVEVGENKKYEIFDYPGEYGKKSEGDELVKLRMGEEESPHLVIEGSSTCRAFTSGYRFELQEHYRRDMNRSYVLTHLHHMASGGQGFSSEAGGGENYTNNFTCVPHSVVYRPPRVTPKPFVQGPQTAVVVGKQGEEIWTDKYGRVKVQFHWDREGKKDENSSCWIRVAHLWAGKRWGAVFMPRIGQEVIVEFLEGDPDQPIITGRVYNAEHMPPYELPGEQTKSTIKSMSSKGGNGFNEMRFEDKKGDEQIFMHAEKNMDVRVKNNSYEWIGNDRHLVVKKDQIEHVENNRSETVDADHMEKIGKDRHVKVAGKEAVEVGGSHSFTVKGDVIEVFKANHSEQTSSDYYLKATNIVIEATSNITIKVGQSHIAIEASGIKIGTMGQLKIESTGPAEVKATAPLTLQSSATAELKSPMTQVKGDGMLILKGGMVMIN